MEISTVQMAAIHAAMMEELGVARKDKLPLEDKQGIRGNVDLVALDRGKKANDPHTVEFQIAQENARAREAWNNHKFEDVNPEDLKIDNMNSGQSHRQRMKAELEASGASRGSHSYHGGRGMLPPRGRANQRGRRASDRARGGDPRSNGLGSSKWGENAHQDIHGILDRLRTAKAPPSGAASNTQGFPRDGSVKATRHAAFPVPTPNLSFKDNRSINELPIAQNASSRGRSASSSRSNTAANSSRPGRPLTSDHKYVLASPADFVGQSWPNKLKGDVSGKRVQTKAEHFNDSVQTVTPKPTIPEIAPRQIRSAQIDPAKSTGSPLLLTTPLMKPTSDLGRVVLHHEVVKAEKLDVHGTTPMGLGTAFIVSYAIGNNQGSVSMEVQVEDKTLIQVPLLESFRYKIESASFEFDSVFAGIPVRWRLTTPLPWIVESFGDAIDRYKSQVDLSTLVDYSIENNVEDLEGGKGVEDLIFFGEEALAQQPFSSFTQDLLGLMDEYVIDQALDAMNCDPSGPLLDRISDMMAVPEPLEQNDLTSAAGNDITASKGAFLGGLETSRFAAAAKAVVGKFLSRSSVFNALPENTASTYTQEVSRRVLEKVQKPVNDDESSANVPQEMAAIAEHKAIMENQHEAGTDLEYEAFTSGQHKARIQYTIEEMIGYRTKASEISKVPVSHPWVQQSRRDASHLLLTGTGVEAIPNPLSPSSPKTQPRKVVNITRLGVPIVAGVEKPLKSQGLASSKYASKPSSKAIVAKPLVTNTETKVNQSPVSSDWKSMKRRDSLNSRTSSETVKPGMYRVPGTTAEALRNEFKYPTSVDAALRRLSVRSTDSGTSRVSFVTASEGESPQRGEHHNDKIMDALSKNLMKVKRVGQDIDAQLAKPSPVSMDNKSSGPRLARLHHEDVPGMTENPPKADSSLIGTTTSQHSLGKTNDLPPAKVGAMKKGLMSSKYAGVTKDVSVAQAKPSVRPISAIIETHLSTASRMQRSFKNLENQAGSVKNTSQPLQPTASQFIPSKTTGSYPATGPVLATVLVPNPLVPGTFKEVHGILKVDSMPIVAYESILHSQNGVIVTKEDENIAPGSTFTGQFPSSAINTDVKPPLSTRNERKGNNDIQGVQQDVQKRLQMSLTQRRASGESMGPRML